MLIHILMTFITSLTLFTSLNFYKYTQILYHNISLALQPQIQQELSDNPNFITALNKSIANHLLYSRIYVPLSILSLINSITIWILLSIEYPLPLWYSLSTALLLATTFTKLLTQDQFPKWFFHWSKLIHATRDEINLQLLRTKLQEIHTQLQEVIDGKQLPETQLNQLKFQGLFLAQQAEQLTKQLEQNKY